VSAYVDQHRERFGVEPIGETLGVSASAYYRRATGERSARQLEDERLLGVIGETHKANYDAYGYRRMWKALTRAGEPVARCQVQRLMAEHGIQGAQRRGRPWRTTKADPSASRAGDLVGRDFAARAPNRLWVGDFTYLRCWEGVLYFSFVLDGDDRRLAARRAHAHHARPRRATDGARAPGPPGPTSSWSLTPTPDRNTPISTTRRSSTTTRCSRRSAPSAMPWTTRSRNPSWIPTRPS
jgi:transposase InsO family protein